MEFDSVHVDAFCKKKVLTGGRNCEELFHDFMVRGRKYTNLFFAQSIEKESISKPHFEDNY